MKNIEPATLKDFLIGVRDHGKISDVVLDDLGEGRFQSILYFGGRPLNQEQSFIPGEIIQGYLNEAADSAFRFTELKKKFDTKHVVDFHYHLQDGIARIHLYENAPGCYGMAIRIQPKNPPDIFTMIEGNEKRRERIFSLLIELYCQPQGLVLITGPVRSGKTWLEHAIYEYFNRPESGPPKHLWLIADPPEFEHVPRHSFYHTRDIGYASGTYEEEIDGALRVPRDIIGIGELRGETTITEAAIRSSLSGGLNAGTGHTRGIASLIQRFTIGGKTMDAETMRKYFTEVVQGIVNLRLIPGRDNKEHLVIEYVSFVRQENMRKSLERGQLLGSIGQDRETSQTLWNDADDLIAEGILDPDVVVNYLGKKP